MLLLLSGRIHIRPLFFLGDVAHDSSCRVEIHLDLSASPTNASLKAGAADESCASIGKPSHLAEQRYNRHVKKFILGFVIGLLFAGLVGVIFLFAAMRLGDRKTDVSANSTLVLHLEGDLPEQAPVDVPIPYLQDQPPMTTAETWQILRKAAADPRIKALVLEPRGLTVGWAKLEELRADVLEFKKSGKPVYAYLRGPGGTNTLSPLRRTRSTWRPRISWT